MVKIRLIPQGKLGQRSFRIRVMDGKKSRNSGDYLEDLGFYNPHNKEIKLVDKDKIEKWLNCGAQPTDTVRSLLKKHL
jgi:small subunit ribosomal protein S16